MGLSLNHLELSLLTHTSYTLLSAIPTQLHRHILTFHLLSHLLLETYLSSTSLLPFSHLQHPLLTHHLLHHSFSLLSLQTIVLSFHHPQTSQTAAPYSAP